MRLLVIDEAVITGGVESIRRGLLPALARACDEVVWVLPSHGQGLGLELAKETPRLQIESFDWPRSSGRKIVPAIMRRLWRLAPGGLRSLGEDSMRDTRVRFLAQRYQSQAVLTTCIFHQSFPRTGLPTGGIIHDLSPLLPDRIVGSMLTWVQRCQFVATVSDFTRDAVLHRSSGAVDRVYTVPLAASLEGPRAVPEAPRSPGSALIFFQPAGAMENKGHRTLFEACSILAGSRKRFKVHLSGGGTERFLEEKPFETANLERARRILNENSQLRGEILKAHGTVSAGKVRELYASADCVVLPSDFEGFGLPLLEALCFGRRVICSDIPPFREQVQRYRAEKWVLFFPAGDAMRLAQLMGETVSGTKDLCDGESLRERLRSWTWGNVSERLLSLFGLPGVKPTSGVVDSRQPVSV